MRGKRGHADLDPVMAGLQAQFARSAKFKETINVVAACETHDRVIKLLDSQRGDLRVRAGLRATPPRFAARGVRCHARVYADVPVPSDRVFTFGDKLLAMAPRLVQACIRQVPRVHPTLRVFDGAGRGS